MTHKISSLRQTIEYMHACDRLREPLLMPEQNQREDDDEQEEQALEGENDGFLVVRAREKGEYSRVSNVEDGIENDVFEEEERIVQEPSLFQNCMLRTLLPDDKFGIADVKLLDGDAAVKLLKFAVLTAVGIFCMFHYIRWMDWENRSSLKLSDLWVYEGNLIALDVVFFFVVGRMHKQRGVDHLAWVLFALCANIYASYINNFRFLQHSFTLYEMHCLWPWKLWVFLLILTPLIITVVVLHIQRAAREGVFVQKLLEITFCVMFLLAPYMTSPYFHFHHWFAGWLVGMHCNFDVWWSRATMAWCWGLYINGVSVYGRDPVLSCGYAYFLSAQQACPYLKCYVEALAHANETNHTHVEPMIPPDWRNCSADTYHT